MPDVEKASLAVDRTYGVRVKRPDLRWWTLRPWWGVLSVGCCTPENGIVRARSRERLVARAERRLRRWARADGIADPIIEVRDA